jgi:hypothetical protein
MAKHVLHTGDEEFEFVLLGMNCAEDQYRMAHLLNVALNLELELNNTLTLNLKDSRLFSFSLYHFQDEDLRLDYFFVPNTSNFEEPHQSSAAQQGLFAELEVEERVKLIKELPKTDFFLILKGDALHNNQYQILDRIKSIPEIIQVQLLEANDLPSKRNLIF